MAADSDSTAMVVGVFGVAVGLFLGARWVRARGAYDGWQSSRGGPSKAKVARTKARTAFMLAARGAFIGIVLLIVWAITTSNMVRR
ncbi:hypothetical protein [Rhizocola hellebori]|nr:hypothetical protein [Rhizocola hellebori]